MLRRIVVVASLLSACAEPSVDPLEARIARVRQAVEADTCFRDHPDGTGCSWGDFPFRPEEFEMAKNSGEAILVIDSFQGELPLSAIRYKNRIRALLLPTGSGELMPFTGGWHVPTVLYSALAEFADPVFIPAERLRSLSPLLLNRYAELTGESTGHGNFVLGTLLELNPEQPVVLMEHPQFHQFARTEFCDPSVSPDAVAALQTKTSSLAAAMRGYLQQFNVRFINASNGVGLENIRSWWTAGCEAPLPSDADLRLKLAAFEPFYDVLFNTPGVFTAHAAYPATVAEDWPFDFPSERFPNRLRFGFFNALESGLDEEGRGDPSALSAFPAEHNADVFLNSGVLPARPYPFNATPLISLDPFGTDALPITRATTSWLTPLGLSRFIHLRYSTRADQPLDDLQISALMDRVAPRVCPQLLDGRCRFQDPLLHGQVEAVRLGYRPREISVPAVLVR